MYLQIRIRISILIDPPIFNIFIWLYKVLLLDGFMCLLWDNKAYFIPFNSELQKSEVIVLTYKIFEVNLQNASLPPPIHDLQFLVFIEDESHLWNSLVFEE